MQINISNYVYGEAGTFDDAPVTVWPSGITVLILTIVLVYMILGNGKRMPGKKKETKN